MSENVVPLEIPVDPDRYQELIRENQMLREEIRVSREAAEITAGLVVKQFEETERVLRRFEDANAMVLQSVHGTGDVTRQVLRFKEAQALLKRNALSSKTVNVWSNLKPASGCHVAGALHKFQETSADLTRYVLEKTRATRCDQLKKANRVQVGDLKLYCKEYTRMKKKVCHFVLTKDEDILSIKYFIINMETEKVYALVLHFKQCKSQLDEHESLKHLISVEASNNNEDVIPIELVKEKLFYINTSEDNAYVACVPNVHGYAVFK
jgi:hypothetical protein